MANMRINCNASQDDTFVPGQLFVFDNMVFHANSTGHLAPIKNFAPYQMVTFRSLEYTMVSHDELALFGWAPDRMKDLSVVAGSNPEPISDLNFGSNIPMGLAPPPIYDSVPHIYGSAPHMCGSGGGAARGGVCEQSAPHLWL